MSVVGLMGRDSDQVIDDQIIETTSSRLRRYYLNRKLDAGSVPVSTTNVRKTNHSRLVFSSPRVGAGLAIGYVVSRLHSPHFPILRALSVSVFLHLSVDCFKGDLLA